MTKQQETDDLIARLEQASGPDRELDAAIAIYVGWRLRQTDFGADWITPDGRCVGLPYFTASIDAALTLVPEGWQWQVSNRAPKPHTGRAYINNRELINTGPGGLTPNKKYRGSETTAATPAIALCIAALHSRAMTDEGRG